MDLKLNNAVFTEAVIVNNRVDFERKWSILYKVLGHLFFILCRIETFFVREYWKMFSLPKLRDDDFLESFLKNDKRKWPVAKILYESSKYVTFLKHHAMEWVAIEAIYTEDEWLKKENTTWGRFITKILSKVENIVATRNRLRNTKREMFWEIISLLRNDTEVIKIVSLASGSARSSIEVVSAILRAHPELKDRFKFWFVDLDPEAYKFALEYAEKCSPGLSEYFSFWQTTISGKEKGLAKLQEFLSKINPNIVEMVGFGDYMSYDKAVNVFRTILENLASGGLLITNNVKPNDEQPFLESVVTWTMVNREEQAVLSILHESGFSVVKTLNEPTDIQPVYVARKI